MNKLLALAADLLFPPRCAVCGEIAEFRKAVCESCMDMLALQLKYADLCPRCGKPVESCVCRSDNAFERCVSAFIYDDDTRAMFAALKSKGNIALASQLAALMAEQFKRNFSADEFDMITYVPVSDKTLKTKGFDHARLLAQQLSELISLPCFAAPIKRSEQYRPQHMLDEKQRWENAYSGYYVENGSSIQGRLLLVDDIMTTGATLNRCAELLLQSGAERVVCITAATTLRSRLQPQ